MASVSLHLVGGPLFVSFLHQNISCIIFLSPLGTEDRGARHVDLEFKAPLMEKNPLATETFCSACYYESVLASCLAEKLRRPSNRLDVTIEHI